MENISQYVAPEVLFIIPALWIIGYFLKMTPKVANAVIVWVILLIGVVLAIATIGLSAEGFVQGVVCAGVAVLGHQLFKQSTQGK
jgi:multisubunit Na+/H+ antiporter MnhC subunit